MTVKVAIIGRPNVGKSTLFNRLTNTRNALVDDVAGLTRDRKEGYVETNGSRFTEADHEVVRKASPSTTSSTCRSRPHEPSAPVRTLRGLADPPRVGGPRHRRRVRRQVTRRAASDRRVEPLLVPRRDPFGRGPGAG